MFWGFFVFFSPVAQEIRFCVFVVAERFVQGTQVNIVTLITVLLRALVVLLMRFYVIVVMGLSNCLVLPICFISCLCISTPSAFIFLCLINPLYDFGRRRGRGGQPSQ